MADILWLPKYDIFCIGIFLKIENIEGAFYSGKYDIQYWC